MLKTLLKLDIKNTIFTWMNHCGNNLRTLLKLFSDIPKLVNEMSAFVESAKKRDGVVSMPSTPSTSSTSSQCYKMKRDVVVSTPSTPSTSSHCDTMITTNENTPNSDLVCKDFVSFSYYEHQTVFCSITCKQYSKVV